MPRNQLPAGLAPLQNPVGRFRQVANGGPNSDLVPLALTSAREETDDDLASPVGAVPLADDHVGGFPWPVCSEPAWAVAVTGTHTCPATTGHEGPLQVAVGLLAHAAVVDVAAVGDYPGDNMGIAGHVLRRGEAVARSLFPVEHDGQPALGASQGISAGPGTGITHWMARVISTRSRVRSSSRWMSPWKEFEQLELLLDTVARPAAGALGVGRVGLVWAECAAAGVAWWAARAKDLDKMDEPATCAIAGC